MSYYLMYGRNLTKLKANAMFPLQYSCLENPMGGEAWWAACCLWGRAESDTAEATQQQPQCRVYFFV